MATTVAELLVRLTGEDAGVGTMLQSANQQLAMLQVQGDVTFKTYVSGANSAGSSTRGFSDQIVTGNASLDAFTGATTRSGTALQSHSAATQQAGQSTQSFGSTLQQLVGSILPGFSQQTQVATQGLTAFNGQALAGVGVLGEFGLGLTALAVGGLAALTSKFVETSDSVRLMSQMTGLSLDTVQSLGYAAEAAGTSSDRLRMSMDFLARNAQQLTTELAQGKEPTSQFALALQTLGISAQNFVQLSPDQQLRALMTAFQELSPSVSRTGLEMDIFSRGGAQMDPIIRANTAGLDSWSKQMNQSGASVSSTQAEVLKLHDADAQLSVSTQALANDVGSGLVPALASTVEMLAKATQAAKDFDERMTGSTIHFGNYLDAVNFMAHSLGYVFPGLSAEMSVGMDKSTKSTLDLGGAVQKASDDLTAISGRIDVLVHAQQAQADAYTKATSAALGNADAQAKVRQEAQALSGTPEAATRFWTAYTQALNDASLSDDDWTQRHDALERQSKSTDAQLAAEAKTQLDLSTAVRSATADVSEQIVVHERLEASLKKIGEARPADAIKALQDAQRDTTVTTKELDSAIQTFLQSANQRGPSAGLQALNDLVAAGIVTLNRSGAAAQQTATSYDTLAAAASRASQGEAGSAQAIASRTAVDQQFTEAQRIAALAVNERGTAETVLQQTIAIGTPAQREAATAILAMEQATLDLGPATAAAALHQDELNASWQQASGAGSTVSDMIHAISDELGSADQNLQTLADHMDTLFGKPTQKELDLKAATAGNTAEIEKWNSAVSNSSAIDQRIAALVKQQDQEIRTGASLSQRASTERDLQAQLAAVPAAEGQAVVAGQQRIDKLGDTNTALAAQGRALEAQRQSLAASTQANRDNGTSMDQLVQVYEQGSARLTTASHTSSTAVGTTATSVDTLGKNADNTALAIGRLVTELGHLTAFNPASLESALHGVVGFGGGAGTAGAGAGAAGGGAATFTSSNMIMPSSWYAAIQGHESTLPLPSSSAPQPMFGIIPGADYGYAVGTGYYSSGGTAAASASLGVSAGQTKQALFPSVDAGVAAFNTLISKFPNYSQLLADIQRGDFAAFINDMAPIYAGPGEAPGFASQVIASFNPGAGLPMTGQPVAQYGGATPSVGAGSTSPPPGATDSGGGLGTPGQEPVPTPETTDETGRATAVKDLADATTELGKIQRQVGADHHIITQQEIDDDRKAATNLGTAYTDALKARIAADQQVQDDYDQGNTDRLQGDQAAAVSARDAAESAGKAWTDAYGVANQAASDFEKQQNGISAARRALVSDDADFEKALGIDSSRDKNSVTQQTLDADRAAYDQRRDVAIAAVADEKAADAELLAAELSGDAQRIDSATRVAAARHQTASDAVSDAAHANSVVNADEAGLSQQRTTRHNLEQQAARADAAAARDLANARNLDTQAARAPAGSPEQLRLQGEAQQARAQAVGQQGIASLVRGQEGQYNQDIAAENAAQAVVDRLVKAIQAGGGTELQSNLPQKLSAAQDALSRAIDTTTNHLAGFSDTVNDANTALQGMSQSASQTTAAPAGPPPGGQGMQGPTHSMFFTEMMGHPAVPGTIGGSTAADYYLVANTGNEGLEGLMAELLDQWKKMSVNVNLIMNREVLAHAMGYAYASQNIALTTSRLRR